MKGLFPVRSLEMFISIRFSINASISLKFLAVDSYCFLINHEPPAAQKLVKRRRVNFLLEFYFFAFQPPSFLAVYHEPPARRSPFGAKEGEPLAEFQRKNLLLFSSHLCKSFRTATIFHMPLLGAIENISRFKLQICLAVD
jgi:hypothetical protein